MTNYEFCAWWVERQRPGADAQVLDYGCGAGQIVTLLRARGIDARGCDVFYEGGDYSAQVQVELLGAAIRRMGEDGTIPFPDASFDLIVNNQVMEHVLDLDRVLSEIARVLKPGGRVLSLFPDRGVWREGHCGIPFLHWFPKRSRPPGSQYAAVLRAAGLGNHKQGKSILHMGEDFCIWLDRWTLSPEPRDRPVLRALDQQASRSRRRWLAHLRSGSGAGRPRSAGRPRPCSVRRQQFTERVFEAFVGGVKPKFLLTGAQGFVGSHLAVCSARAADSTSPPWCDDPARRSREAGRVLVLGDHPPTGPPRSGHRLHRQLCRARHQGRKAGLEMARYESANAGVVESLARAAGPVCASSSS
ncbi:MAG: class I SAM-dependent methyltransferase [Steroidobacteraceae bacterium]